MIWFKPLLLFVLSMFIAHCSHLPPSLGGEPALVETSSATRQSPHKGAGSQSGKTVNSSVDNRLAVKKHEQSAELSFGKMIFLRSSFVASAVAATVYDVTSGSPIFVAEVKNNTQVDYPLDSGHYTFMLASGGSLDYLDVYVLPKRSYFAIVKPSMGAWKPSFSFTPVKSRDIAMMSDLDDVVFFGDKQFRAVHDAVGEVVEVSSSGSVSGHKIAGDLMAQHLEQWPKWKRQSPEKHALKTLNSADGV